MTPRRRRGYDEIAVEEFLGRVQDELVMLARTGRRLRKCCGLEAKILKTGRPRGAGGQRSEAREVVG